MGNSCGVALIGNSKPRSNVFSFVISRSCNCTQFVVSSLCLITFKHSTSFCCSIANTCRTKENHLSTKATITTTTDTTLAPSKVSHQLSNCWISPLEIDPPSNAIDSSEARYESQQFRFANVPRLNASSGAPLSKVMRFESAFRIHTDESWCPCKPKPIHTDSLNVVRSCEVSELITILENHSDMEPRSLINDVQDDRYSPISVSPIEMVCPSSLLRETCTGRTPPLRRVIRSQWRQ